MAEFTREAVQALSAHLEEPQWMLDLRLAAFEIYENTPMPTIKDEAWRRTNIRRLKLDKIGPSVNGEAGQSNVPVKVSSQMMEVPAGGELVQVDGVTQSYKISDELKAQGVIFCDMSTAVTNHPDLVQKYFMTQAVKADEGKFAALHAAFWRGGTFLYVPRNVQAAAPLHTSQWNANGKTFTHTLVVMETGSEAVFSDEYGSSDAKAQFLHNGAVELIVGDNASLTYISLQEFGNNMWQFTHERGRVGRDGKLDWIMSIMGTGLSKQFQTVELDQSGAWARMSGLFFGDMRQHFDLDTQQNHNAERTTSDLLYKGAMKHKARSVWQGMIKATPGAQQTDGFQANRNLLLENSARADSIPGLEIEADDVRCTHASTIGKLDEEEIFYLMSRGIEREMALRMVVQGFFDPIMQRIPFEGVQHRIAERIIEKVGSLQE
ncbi:MAG: Fe-S cluster assembly protein SufD [Ardenticatenaceae bacterium]|nr:Fe-S cluster assembly protein SufD [Ardenticatenaceae bacterium]